MSDTPKLDQLRGAETPLSRFTSTMTFRAHDPASAMQIETEAERKTRHAEAQPKIDRMAASHGMDRVESIKHLDGLALDARPVVFQPEPKAEPPAQSGATGATDQKPNELKFTTPDHVPPRNMPPGPSMGGFTARPSRATFTPAPEPTPAAVAPAEAAQPTPQPTRDQSKATFREALPGEIFPEGVKVRMDMTTGKTTVDAPAPTPTRRMTPGDLDAELSGLIGNAPPGMTGREPSRGMEKGREIDR